MGIGPRLTLRPGRIPITLAFSPLTRKKLSWSAFIVTPSNPFVNQILLICENFLPILKSLGFRPVFSAFPRKKYATRCICWTRCTRLYVLFKPPIFYHFPSLFPPLAPPRLGENFRPWYNAGKHMGRRWCYALRSAFSGSDRHLGLRGAGGVRPVLSPETLAFCFSSKSTIRFSIYTYFLLIINKLHSIIMLYP